MRRMGLGIAGLLLLAALAGCSGGSAGAGAFAGGAGKVKVAASFYPMYEFARRVGGDHADVLEMVPAGVEPHDWEPTAADLQALNAAQLFVYNGIGMEAWVDKTLASLDNKRLVVVETSRGLSPEEWSGEDGRSPQPDPHAWLDPLAAAKQVEAIRDGFIAVDPANRPVYESNAAAFVSELEKLDADYRTALGTCREQRFFTSHTAFGYLARRYGLTQRAIMGLTPDAEPTPKELARIVSEAKAEGVSYIFFETLVSPKVANLVAGEIGAKTLVLNPLEGLTRADQASGKNYLTVMRENLANLTTALECGK